MNNINALLEREPFSMEMAEKESIFLETLIELSQKHKKDCKEYNKIISLLGIDLKDMAKCEDVPFLPVRIFKEFEMMSTDKTNIVKTMTSSGTTGQSVSKIFLDKETALNQTKVLAKIVSSYLGNKRLPMLVIDTNAVVKDRNLFSARGAGILGFSMLGYDVTYALDENMNINIEKIQSFLEKHKNEKIMVFGFTYMIWEYFYLEMLKNNIEFALENGILIHGGGWKKLIDKSVDNETFKKSIYNVCRISKIYNYYGMVEQTGSIFMECEEGYLHASNFSDIIIRDYVNFNNLGENKKGLIQLLSLIPESYPGHSILSEDEGEIIGTDTCKCGRKGKYFKVYGRIKDAEVRGCSDTYASNK